MKYTVSAALAAFLAAQNVAAHATFQDLWVDGVDFDTQCARQPTSNSPVTDVTSADMACNAGTTAVSSKCPVTAGSTVTGMSRLASLLASLFFFCLALCKDVPKMSKKKKDNSDMICYSRDAPTAR